MMEMANDQKKILEAQISELQSTLSSAVRSHESMREENLSLERQAELLTMETSTVGLTFNKVILTFSLIF